jgi:biopolymer transport protein ExbD
LKIRRQEIKRARIEIIPMIDTIFFLLVYFMVASLAMVQMSAYRVNLPQSDTAAGRPQEQVVVSLSAQNRIYLDRAELRFALVKQRLKERVEANPKITIIINVDRSRTVKQFLHVMNIAEAADPAHIVIATAPEARH